MIFFDGSPISFLFLGSVPCDLPSWDLQSLFRGSLISLHGICDLPSWDLRSPFAGSSISFCGTYDLPSKAFVRSSIFLHWTYDLPSWDLRTPFVGHTIDRDLSSWGLRTPFVEPLWQKFYPYIVCLLLFYPLCPIISLRHDENK